MLTHILSLLALSLLCVLWVVFQNWLAKQDSNYKGYKAGCGGCTRSCGDNDTESCDSSEKKVKEHYIDASSLWSKNK